MQLRPRERKRSDSARVLNCGPSMQITVPEGCVVVVGGPRRRPGVVVRVCRRRARRGGSKGWAMGMWPTVPDSKKVQGRTWNGKGLVLGGWFSDGGGGGGGMEKVGGLTPFVQSSTWSTTTKSRGLTSSFRLPTALKPTTHVTPSLFNAATLARFGISCGAYWWWRPCLARKAIVVAFGSGVEVDDGGV